MEVEKITSHFQMLIHSIFSHFPLFLHKLASKKPLFYILNLKMSFKDEFQR